MSLRLVEAQIEGFRCLRDVRIDFEDLTVLIGENDAGKSSVLDALDLLFSGDAPDLEDYFQSPDGSQAEEISVSVVLEGAQVSDDNEYLVHGGKVSLKGAWNKLTGDRSYFYRGERPKDSRLSHEHLSELNAGEQKDLIRELDPSVGDDEISNQAKRDAWLNEYRTTAKKMVDWIPLSRGLPTDIPRMERYSALDYTSPGTVIFKTIRQLYEDMLYEQDEGDSGPKKIIPDLKRVQDRARREIEEKIKELAENIERYDDRVRNLRYDPVFDFPGSLKQGEFHIDAGRGAHPLDKVGDGTKRRMFMAVSEWDREVVLESAEKSSRGRTVIRGYDEPDTSLHYEAQRIVYQSISHLTRAPESNIQAVICTHSLTLIDRAPARSIRLLQLNNKGETRIDQLDVSNDPDVETFLAELANHIGITNSIMFYERCYLMVEGETELVCLPILYKKLYGRSLLEDGIRVIPVNGTGALSEILKLFANNRASMVQVMVDQDSEDDPAAGLKSDSLLEAGFDESFIESSVHYVGEQELEDLFPDAQFAQVLNSRWPKPGGDTWEVQEIAELREEGKFSKQLRKKVYEEVEYGLSKPDLMRNVADVCPEGMIPNQIQEVFQACRGTAGIGS